VRALATTELHVDVVLSILSVVDRIANRPDASDFMWGNDDGRCRILSSHRLTSPNPSSPDDEPDGYSHATSVYAVAVG